jgi:hypothetical protein
MGVGRFPEVTERTAPSSAPLLAGAATATDPYMVTSANCHPCAPLPTSRPSDEHRETPYFSCGHSQLLFSVGAVIDLQHYEME